MRGTRQLAFTIAAAASFWLAAPAGAQGSAQGAYAQRYAALCAACHGANGRSDAMPGTPVLAGPQSC